MKTLVDASPLKGRQSIETNQYLEKLLKAGKYSDLLARLKSITDDNRCDLWSLLKYALVLEKVGEHDKAKEMVEKLDKFYKEDEIFSTKFGNGGRNNVFNNPRYYELKMFLLIEEHKYKEAYTYFDNFMKAYKYVHPNVSDRDFRYMRDYQNSKFNYYLEKDVVHSCEDIYSISQLYNYDKDKLIQHVKDHTFEDSYDEVADDGLSTFNNEIDLNTIYDLIQENFDKVKPITNGLFTEVRNFKYDRVGINNYKPCNYLRVINYKFNNKIITFFPVLNLYTDTYDITPKEEIKEDKNIKRLSMIEKFNKRYGK